MDVKVLLIFLTLVLLLLFIVALALVKASGNKKNYDFCFPKAFPKNLRLKIEKIVDQKIFGEEVFTQEGVKKIISSRAIQGEWELQRPSETPENVWVTTKNLQTQEMINHISSCLGIYFDPT